MEYSEKLNGYWEEGYHFYIEIRDDKMIVREYRRKVTLETKISYDAAAVEAGRKTPITLENNVLSVGGANNPMSWFEEFYYEDGLLKAVEGYSFMERKDPYTMKKVDHGPFDHIVIRDEEYLPKLQGVWIKWSPVEVENEKRECLIIDGNTFMWRLYNGKIHVISYNKPGWDNESVFIVPYDLTEADFRGCTRFEIHPDMITGHEMVYDMMVPMSVFAREEDIDKIEVPAGAKTVPRPAMGPAALDGMPNMIFDQPMLMDPSKPGDTSAPSLFAKMMMNQGVLENEEEAGRKAEQEDDNRPKPVYIPVEKEGDDPYRLKEPYKCSCCGTVFEDHLAKFCWNCGAILRS
ncbi:MAG: hypothetical protein J5824_00775 [Lachnospiraceae bacterium]|nr:hypothetical protein [Lachnospiraceae bacterium]